MRATILISIALVALLSACGAESIEEQPTTDPAPQESESFDDFEEDLESLAIGLENLDLLEEELEYEDAELE